MSKAHDANNHTPQRTDVTCNAILPLWPFPLKVNLTLQSYQDYQAKQAGFEQEANDKHEPTGAIVHWFLLLSSAAISANEFYAQFIGAQNAALLVVAARWHFPCPLAMAWPRFSKAASNAPWLVVRWSW